MSDIRRIDAHVHLWQVDHGAKPAIASGAFKDWASEMAALARDTDVHCKLSGLVTEAGTQWKPGVLEPYIDCSRRGTGTEWPMQEIR